MGISFSDISGLASIAGFVFAVVFLKKLYMKLTISIISLIIILLIGYMSTDKIVQYIVVALSIIIVLFIFYILFINNIECKTVSLGYKLLTKFYSRKRILRIITLFNKFKEESKVAAIELDKINNEKGILEKSNYSEVEYEKFQKILDRKMQVEVGKVLDLAQSIMCEACKTSDISASIRIVENSTGVAHIIKTFVRVMSVKERVRASRTRSNDEKFFVFPSKNMNELVNNDTISEYFSKYFPEEKQGDYKLRINTVYNRLMYTSDKRFVCNYLDKATKDKKFYTNSDDRELYYHSVLGRRIEAWGWQMQGNCPIDNELFGLLIFDSFKEGIFHTKITDDIGDLLISELAILMKKVHKYGQNKYLTQNIV